ncbi:MAG: Nif3-like dinuclear metal center hexameric protein [Halalkalicoccus sp.]|nr:Nif3-like dinuclear metal center hexameric protein [Halalkalicoccus sp.]
MALTTDEIMQLSLDLVGWEEVPADSQVYVPGEGIETALVGIDLESPEIQLAEREGYDLALAHHPVGESARLDFSGVLSRQVEFMTDHGVPESEAEAAVTDLRENVEFGAHSSNYRHDPSVAELLEQPYMNVHLAPDEIGRRRFVEVAEGMDTGSSVGEFVEELEEIPELDAAATDVEVRVGSGDNELGEVAVHHAAGTNGGADVARAYFENGVDTVLYIHVGAGDARELREEYEGKNLVVTGHIASDAIGLNSLIDALEERGIECTPISGCSIGRS